MLVPIMILLITITAGHAMAGADAAYQIYPRVLRCVIMSGGGVSAVSHTRDHDQWSGGPSRLQVRCQCVDVQAVLLALVDSASEIIGCCIDISMFKFFFIEYAN